MEWRNDGGMRWIWELRVLPWFKNIPSFHLIPSFHHHSWTTKLLGMKWEWLKWLLDDISQLWIFIPCHSRYFQMTKEWRNEVEWGCFWRGRKKLNCETPVILPSFDHSNVIPRLELEPKKRKLDPSASPLDQKWLWNEKNESGMRVEWDYNKRKLDPSASPLDQEWPWNEKN